jgi:hypothetical protein
MVAPADGGSHSEPEPEIEIGNAGQKPGPVGMRDPVIAVRARPSVPLQEPLHPSLYVERPGARALLVAQRENRNADLHRPAVLVPLGRRLPDPVPALALALTAVGDERVIAGASRVHGEDVSGPPVAERVDHDFHVILGVEVAVSFLGKRDDPRGIGVLANDAEEDRLWLHEDADERTTARRIALVGLDHHQVLDPGRGGPVRFVQDPVDGDGLVDATDREGWRSARLGRCSRELRRGENREQQKSAQDRLHCRR